MTRKRFIKLLMSQGVQKNDAEAIARMVRLLIKEGEQNGKNLIKRMSLLWRGSEVCVHI